jgi:hypothetical protein
MADEHDASEYRLDASEFRFAPSNPLAGLGLLGELAGKWDGHGMNLIGRPAFHYKALNPGPPPFQPDVFLQINFTKETLEFHPIGSPVPNRGFLNGQDDVNLFGLTYLQKIKDAAFPGIGAMHIEPGIWIHENPKEVNPDDTPPPDGEVVTRMASIPHGNAILAQGIARHFVGTPVLPASGVAYNGSLFPAFNSTPSAAAPFSVGPDPIFSAATTSMAGLAAANPTPPVPPGLPNFPDFPQYTLTNPLTNHDPGSRPVGLTQAMINDPIVVLQDEVHKNLSDGFTFEGGTSLNICTASQVQFQQLPNHVIIGAPPPVTVSFSQFNGGAQNTVFLADRQPKPPPSGNALTQIIYATFWIERLRHKMGYSLLQLQYAQMVTLNFPAINTIIPVLPPPAPPGPTGPLNLAWPHITVGTLRKVFG